MKVGEMCNREVIVARKNETIVQAAQRMREFHVGDLVVVDDIRERKPVGILTDRDIVVSAVAQSADKLESLLVGDVMTSSLVTAREDDSMESALMKMRTHGVRRLPVVSRDGILEGILTFDDCVELMSEELTDLTRLVARQQKREREVRV